jgi:hypothetical protein
MSEPFDAIDKRIAIDKALKNLPPEVILEAREMRERGAFRKKIVKRRPKDLDWDVVELECGHRTQTIAKHTPDGAFEECKTCIESWMLEAGGKKQSEEETGGTTT